MELEFTQASVSKIYTARLKSMHLLIAASAKNSQGCRVPVADRILMIFVYRCDVIPFDMTGNNNDTGGPIDEKSYQWFGASISSSGDDGVIVVRLSFLLGKNPASLAAFLIFEGAGESSPQHHSIYGKTKTLY